MSLNAGSKLGGYEILEPIGAGGMGEVYRARDTALLRDVAVKTLRPELAPDSDRLRRFEQEARSASALNHPNIIHIYAIGEQEGTHFIVMEYVEGRTLRDVLDDAPLPTEKVVEIAVQIAAGLAKAHTAGIAHRDLKPANLMVTDEGYVKILDFGLAKLLPGPTPASPEMATRDKLETGQGVVVGTAQYMSPEQAMGRKVDARTDQFSLGSILYEMATGKLAFPRDSVAQTMAAIIEDESEPVQHLNPEVPAALIAIVERCLRKDPGKRYESTGELARELKSVSPVSTSRRAGRKFLWTAAGLLTVLLAVGIGLNLERWGDLLTPAATPSPIESLVVLPLHNVSGDLEQEYLADGMTEALITDLAKIGALKVIARTSAMRYKGTDKTLGDIASDLNVNAVLEGSFLRVGDRVRVTAQLVDVQTQQALWAESYERHFDDLVVLHGELARAVAREIEVAVVPEHAGRLPSDRRVNPEAYEAVLKGHFHSYRLTPADLDTALSYFELALEKDPSYAPAYVGVANVWGGRNQMGYVPSLEAVPRMKAAILKALELDEALAEAHHSLAALETWGEWDWPSAERAFERALELNPNNADTLRSYSHFLNIMGRPEEAMRQIERALELDPFNAMSIAFHGVDLLFVRRYEEAAARFRDALETSPRLPFAHMALTNTLHLQGKYEEALATYTSFLAAIGDREGQEALRRGHQEGGYTGAMRRLAETFAARALRTHTGGNRVVELYLRAGEKERALEWLERAFQDRLPSMPYLGLPQFDPVRDDPRFQDLLRRMNLPA